jgi:hypothetical protein
MAAIAMLASAPAEARTLAFHATLDGKSGPAPTGSDATGRARIKVDTDSKKVSVEIDVDGIGVPQLWAKLVAAPIGPIHFHKYASPAGGDSVLVLPLPYGASYRNLPNGQNLPGGMSVRISDYDYSQGARLLNSTLSFDEFLAAMNSGLVILNVHTETFNAGEISGKIVAD